MTINLDKNLITNIAGAVGAVAIAVGPVVDGVQGDMTTNDWGKLAAAAAFAILGYFSGKGQYGQKLPKG